jgi:hypothetical protein
LNALSKKQRAQEIHSENPPQPPQAPEIETRLRQYPYQWVGIPIIMLIALLGLLGVFGNTTATAEQEGNTLGLTVEYPERMRFRTDNRIVVEVANLGDQALDQVTVHFDEAYIGSFARVTFTPDVQAITDDAYIVALSDLGPGETQTVEVELEGEEYWRRTGEVRASAGEDSVAVSLSTFVFP